MQTRAGSLIETITNIAAGLGIALAVNALMFPALGVPVTAQANLIVGTILTVASLARQYVLRRLFVRLGVRVPISPAMLAVMAERQRQRDVEGWTDKHDDEHAAGELARAGACYALADCGALATVGVQLADRPGRDGAAAVKVFAFDLWRWSSDWWKPVDRRRNLVKAGALILAEIERHDRNRRAESSRVKDAAVAAVCAGVARGATTFAQHFDQDQRGERVPR
jgi:hypothetical protein